MTPFLQFRLWWRRGSNGEKAAATVATVIVLALAAWVLVPTSRDKGSAATNLQAVSGSDTPTTGAAGGEGATAETVPGATSGPGGQATGGATSSAGAQATSGGASAPGGQATGAAAPTEGAAAGKNCLPTPSGSAGVTDKSISVAFALLDLAGPIGNSAANQASADDQEKFAKAVVADVNARGGIACRAVTAKFYKLNPIGTDQGRSGCLQILQDHPAIVADVGGFAFPQSAYNCIAQQKVPILTAAGILTSEASKFAPYLGTPAADLGTVMRDTAFGLKETGFFDPAKGFKKLGLLYDQCAPEVNKALDDALAKAGITAAQTSKYTFACPPNGFASPAEMAQAVAQHRAAGVTHVIPLTGGGSFKPYTETAQGQGFHPRYAVTDYQGMQITAASSLKPNPDNFDGAVSMTPSRFGMDSTPGFPVDAATKRCQGFAAKAGLSPDVAYRGGGGTCAMMSMIEAALDHAKALTPDAMLPGLFAAGPIALPYPYSDATFKAPTKFYGGDTWGPIEWAKSCSCWHIRDANRRPSFA